MGKLLHLSDVPGTVLADARWQPLNEHLGIRAFGINAVQVEPGGDADIEHDETHSGHQQVYVVVSGRAAFRLGDEEVEAGPGVRGRGPRPGGNPPTTARWRTGTVIICVGAEPVGDHPYGEWIGEAAESS